MNMKTLAGRFTVSNVGIGGHYKRMEEGAYEQRYALVSQEEVEERIRIIEKAVASGINYFDTTWLNEVEMLGRVVGALGVRDKIFINGMILGAFTGPKAFGQELEEYFNEWLDKRLALLPDHRFNSLMINAIEEGYDEAGCRRLVRLLEKRQADGDFSVFGISCHDPFHARKVADTFPEFQMIMIPYNYRNRRFEEAFAGYSGNASIIAMKPLVWAEYGISFCAVNRQKNFEANFGFAPAEDASARALKFLASNPVVTTAVCAVNSMEELDLLIAAGNGSYTAEDQAILESYNRIQTQDGGIPLFVSALWHNNLRMNYFGTLNLSRVLKVPMPEIPLNRADTRELLEQQIQKLMEQMRLQGYERYLND